MGTARHGSLALLLLIMLVVGSLAFPRLAGEDGVVLLGAGMTQDPPSPDASQQDAAMQASANSAQSAGAAAAAAESDPANGDIAKAAGQQAIVTKAEAGGADITAVAAQAASAADPEAEATEGPDRDEKAIMARSQSVSRAEDVDNENAERQARAEKAALVQSVPTMKGVVDTQMEKDAIPPLDAEGSEAAASSEAHAAYVSRGTNHNAPRPLPDKGIPGFHHLAKMTVPLDGATVLNKIFGSLSECQEACKRATLCNGVEYSKAGGGICLLLKRGIQWSSTFDYYDKDGTQDPVLVAKNDKKLMWGKISERSHDLGGLAMNDVPGATVYRPPTPEEVKERKARPVIRHMARQISEERRKAALDTQVKLKQAQGEQTHAMNVVGETREVAKRVKAKQQRVQHYNVQAEEHSAQVDMSAQEMSARAKFLFGEYKRTNSQAQEYAKAAAAFTEAGNPMAEVMSKKAKDWTAKASQLEKQASSASARAQLEKQKAKIAAADAAHWHQQTAWADGDEKQSADQLEMADKLEHDAGASLASYAKAAKEAKYKLNCAPICGMDFENTDESVPVQNVDDQSLAKTRPAVYTPEPVRDNPLMSRQQFQYTPRATNGEWDYVGTPVARSKLPNDLSTTHNTPSEAVQDMRAGVPDELEAA